MLVELASFAAGAGEGSTVDGGMGIGDGEPFCGLADGVTDGGTLGMAAP